MIEVSIQYGCCDLVLHRTIKGSAKFTPRLAFGENKRKEKWLIQSLDRKHAINCRKR